MKTLFVLLALTALASCSHTSPVKEQRKPANFPDIPVEISKVEDADYICSHPGGAYAIKSSKPVRIWQGELEDGKMVDGIELSKVTFSRLRSTIHAFQFTGVLMGQISVKGHSYYKTENKTQFLDIEMSPLNPDQGEDDVTKVTLKCSQIE
jgi:hypothetical protein